MNISATYNGSSVRVVDIGCNGSNIYVTYVNASNQLIVDRAFLSGSGTVLAISASGS